MAQNIKKTITPNKSNTTTAQVKNNIVSSIKTKNIETNGLEFAFGKENYRLLLIGLGFLLIGYILMIGGGSEDPNVFSDKIYDFQRLTLAPILLIIGFVIEVFAIMIKPKD
ncbi:MAG: DUF3098 domain-containing protein [Bacteroidetes bacterium]|nr:DUF3098 domain-containing protein [Bacteroidota bacterium]